jgi:hypothetical protein
MDTGSGFEARELTDSELELIAGGTTPSWTMTSIKGIGSGYLVSCPMGSGLFANNNGTIVLPGNAYNSFQCVDNSGGNRGAYVYSGAGGMWDVATLQGS